MFARPRIALPVPGKLISRIDKTDNDSTVAEPNLGSDPVALLMFDTLGYMSVQIMKRNRPDSVVMPSDTNPNNSLPINGYDAYFGTYVMDTSKAEIRYEIEGSMNKNDIGKVLTRNYYLSEDILRLSFQTENNEIPVTRTLKWIRIKNKDDVILNGQR